MIFLAGIAYWDEWNVAKDKQGGDSKIALLSFEKDKIESMEFFCKGDPALRQENLKLKIQNTGDRWQITEPVISRGDGLVINSFIKHALEFRAERIVKEHITSKNDLEPYGLTDPQMMISFRIRGEQKDRTLIIGGKSPVGYHIYLSDQDLQNVYLGSQYILIALRKKLYDFRYKKLVEVDLDRLTAIKFENYYKDKFELKKVDHRWVADSISSRDYLVDQTMAALSKIYILGFIDNFDQDVRDLFNNRSFLLGKFSLYHKDGIVTLKFISKGDRILALSDSGRFVAEVDSSILAFFKKRKIDFIQK